MADSKESQAAGASDPSMEDILASIRRILNEDEAAAPAAAPAESAPPPPPGPMRAPPPPAPTAEVPMHPAPGADPTEPLDLTEAMLIQAPSAPAPAPGPFHADGLLDAVAAQAAAASMGSLIRAVAADRGAAVHRGGPTIEDVVREELRPLLKTWLDQHLPPLVERLVRAEIERVVGRSIG